MAGVCQHCMRVTCSAVARLTAFCTQMLMHERLSRPPARGSRHTASLDELCARAASLDDAASRSGAYAGALAVNFRPSHMPDSLALMHEHVLCRVKECT